jgi:hypothetical protein
MSRREFLDYFGEEYAPGHHVTFLAPTQSGKTLLSHQMLAQVISPDFQAVLLAGKPPGRDGTMELAAKRLNLKVIEEWPPPWSPRKNKNGYVLRPHHSMEDFKADNANVAKHFRAAMVDCYRSKKPVILDVDEGFHVQNEYKLRGELEAPLMRGAPIVAVWTLVQRGRYMTYFIYDAPEWILVFKDNDKSNRQRYSEIGGVDPDFIMDVQKSLQTKTIHNDGKKSTISEALCIRRSGQQLFIVGMD